jgi:uncharacterized protein
MRGSLLWTTGTSCTRPVCLRTPVQYVSSLYTQWGGEEKKEGEYEQNFGIDVLVPHRSAADPSLMKRLQWSGQDARPLGFLLEEGIMTSVKPGQVLRLRIYLGEDKRDGDQPLYEAIIRQARRMRMAGATVLRGTEGYGRSTRLHTADVLFSRDLPVIVEIVDLAEKIDAMVACLEGYGDIGLMTREPVELCGRCNPELTTPGSR